MTIATAPREFATIQHLLETKHNQDFIPAHMGGPNWALVSDRADGTWVINGDYGISWYPGKTWNEDGSEPTRYADFTIEYDDETDEPSNLAEFAAWATEYMTAPGATESETDRNTRAEHEGHEAGAAAYAAYGDLAHHTMTDLAVTAAHATFTEGGSARAIYSMAFVAGYNAAQADAR